MAKKNAKLVPHDGVSEVFVCRNCVVQVDPVGGCHPGYTQAQCDDGECPHCGGTDTAWLFAPEQADEEE